MAEKKTDIAISGMTCAACANRIEKGLQRMNGVSSATVNFATEKASVAFNEEETDLTSLQDKIRTLGYDVLKEEVDLNIVGMTCAACSARIEKVLNRMEGVQSATVNLALETGKVSFDPSVLSSGDFIKKIQSLGYDAELKNEQNSEKVDHKKEKFKRRRVSLISAALSLPLTREHFTYHGFTYQNF
jgi:Cu+-exporting ATPase